MIVNDASRRDLFRLAAAGAALTAATLAPNAADAYQGNMERALAALQDALASLRHATPDKGGHRSLAMDLVRQAIHPTQAGIRFANEHARHA